MTEVSGGDHLEVLLIEDSPSDAALFSDRMAETGVIDPVVVGDLGQALTALRDHPFDCVVVDLHLPDARGLEAVTAILHAAPEVPLVALTRFDSDELGREAVRTGAQDYIGKQDASVNRLRQALTFAVERHALRKRDSTGQITDTLQMLLEELADQVARARTRPVEDLRSPLEMIANLVQHALVELESTATPSVRLADRVMSGQTAEVEAVLTAAFRLLDPLLQARSTSMRIGQMPAVVADPEGLQEVMLHLLRHALLRMPPGGVIQVDAHPQGASWVMEIIADQEDTTGTDDASGGLDLSGASLEFCEHMVAGWGGELWTRASAQALNVMFRLPGRPAARGA